MQRLEVSGAVRPLYGSYRTANLQSCILYIYSTNIGTEYFKHGIYFFPFKMQFVS